MTTPVQSLQADPVGWQSNPNRRGTMAIIQSIIFTILACTWSIQHLNIPGPKDGFWTKLLRRCKWTLLTILLPEFLMAHAIFELTMGLTTMKAMDKAISSIDDSENFANDIRVVYPWWCRKFPWWRGEKVDAVTRHQWTLTHSYYANMGGFCVQGRQYSVHGRKQKQPCIALTGPQIARYWKHIDLPFLSEREISDKSKADFFTKAIATVQIASLLLSIIVRTVRGLDFSQLELITLAFAACGVFTYVARWYKPQNVDTATTVKLRVEVGSEQYEKMKTPAYDRFWQAVRYVQGDTERIYEGRIPNDYLPQHRPLYKSLAPFLQVHPALYALTIISIVLGSLHLIAWNFRFPTRIEQIWWRIAALISVGLPPIALLLVPVFASLHRRLRKVNTYQFMGTLMLVLRDITYHLEDQAERRPMLTVLEKIEAVYEGPQEDLEKYDYRELLFSKRDEMNITQSSEDAARLRLFKRMTAFFWDAILYESEPLAPKEFVLQFEDLLNKLRSDSYANEAVRLDRYPTLRLRWPAIIFTATGIIYCISRLSIIALAFSCLRSMPDSVYVTTWATYIPEIQ